MNDMILLKQGEIVLKGQNRRAFEQRLIAHIRRRLKPHGSFRVYAIQSTVYVEPEADADLDGAFDALKTVLGVVALSRAAACEKSAEAIAAKAIEYLADDMRAAKASRWKPAGATRRSR